MDNIVMVRVDMRESEGGFVAVGCEGNEARKEIVIVACVVSLQWCEFCAIILMCVTFRLD